MKNIYGFILTNKAGIGFKRWFNSDTEILTDNALGRLPNIIN
jgi:hypothetical protein